MALVQCPECGSEVSDRAASCPHCGYPLVTDPQARTGTGIQRLPIFVAAVGLLVALGIAVLPVSVDIPTGEVYACGPSIGRLFGAESDWRVESLAISMQVDRGTVRFTGSVDEFLAQLPDQQCPSATGSRLGIAGVVAAIAVVVGLIGPRILGAERPR